MSDLLRIREMRTTFDAESARQVVESHAHGFHESCLRAYNILERVKRDLAAGVPPATALELIALMEGK